MYQMWKHSGIWWCFPKGSLSACSYSYMLLGRFFAVPSVIDELSSYLEQRNTKIPRIVQNLSNTSPDNSDGILGLLFEFSTVIIHLTHFYYHDRIAYVRWVQILARV